VLGSSAQNFTRVYAAYDPELDRKVALKLLRPKGAGLDNTEARTRLLREAQVLARLSHPNVIVVHDVGTVSDRVFVAMEFIDGHTVAYWLNAKTRTWREILQVFVAAGRGLAAAHAAQLVHRDFKAENVMITPAGQVRVMDFGLARPLYARTGAPPPAGTSLGAAELDRTMDLDRGGGAAGDHAGGPPVNVRHEVTLTRPGKMVGTPAYMAPEQFCGLPTDARSDQFSFCVALYEALFGQRPFAGRTMDELAEQVLRGNVRAPPATARVPGWVRRAVMRGLERRAEARWPSMDSLLGALARAPRARTWWYGGAAAVVASAVAAVVIVRSPPAPALSCAVPTDRFAGVWETIEQGARRKAIEASMIASGSPKAAETFAGVARLLNDYVAAWSAMYRDACEATNVRGEQSNEVLDLRMGCLRERWNELRALSDVLVEGQAVVVANAITAATQLAPLARCADVSALRSGLELPSDPMTRQRVSDLRERLAGVKALQDAGRYARALDEAVQIAAAARAIGHRPLVAEALNRLAQLQLDGGRPQDADATFEEALWLAEASRHDELVAEIATSEIYVAGYIERDMARARHWMKQAQVFLERIGGHDLLRAWMLNNVGVVLDANGEREEAVAQYWKALAIKERVLGKDHPDVSYTLLNLCDALRALGRPTEAIALSNRGVEIIGRTFGWHHVRLAPQLANRAGILNQLGRFTEARRDAERALALQEGEVGSRSDLVYSLGPLGEAELGLGHAPRAVGLLERAVKLAEEQRALDDELPRLQLSLAQALWDSGSDRRRARDIAAAVAAAMRAAGPNRQDRQDRPDRADGDAPRSGPAHDEPLAERAARWLAEHPSIGDEADVRHAKIDRVRQVGVRRHLKTHVQ